jgi:intracellular sulfur oxidation DsrE/DsrF family protein
MKRKLMILPMFLIAACLAYGQQADYKVLFDMSTRDSVSQQAVVREVELIRKHNPDAKIEVVIYGQGLPLVLKDRSKHAVLINSLLQNKNTEFKVCAFTMQRFEVDESKLLPGVQVVPDGIYEIISKQREGWGYIKVAH